MKTLSENAQKFADACFDNSIEELQAALTQNSADKTDCKTWGITPTEWRDAIRAAIAEKGGHNMKTYRISNANRDEELSIIEAESHAEAAAKFARRGVRGGNATMTAFRTTGDIGKSGMFKKYRKVGQKYNSVGESFHVSEI